MKTVAVISFTNLFTDPRVNRQIGFLSRDYSVIALGRAAPQIEGVRFVSLSFPRLPFLQRRWSRLFRFKRLGWILLLLRRFERYYWSQIYHRQVLQTLSRVQADLILANDIETLPIVLKAANGAKVIFDAHEYAPREFEESLAFRIFYQKHYEYLCRRYIPETDAMLTVCEGIADRYASDTGVKPTVVTNAAAYAELEPVFLKDNQKIRLIHHGNSSPTRKLEKMIRMMDFLGERFELNLMLMETNRPYLERLKSMAGTRSDVRFLPPVQMRELPHFLRQFDVGVYILEPGSFNNRHALPNKIFEFIQARLAIAIGPSPEMARIVRKHGCGVIADDFSPESLARRLRDLDFRIINRFKEQNHRNAKKLSAEGNREIILDLVRNVLDS